MNFYYKNRYPGDTNILYPMINILKNDIYESDILTFRTNLN